MAHIDKASSVPLLLKALQDNDAWVRYFAARSLGNHKALEGTSQLTQVVQLDKFNHVRIAALDALGQLGGEQAAAVASAILENAPGDLAQGALAALGRIRHSDALPPLIAATRSPDLSIKLSALAALGMRGGDEVIEPLQRAAMDGNSAVFEKAIAILGELATTDAIGGLIDLVAEPLRREACIGALAKVHDVEEVAKGLSHRSPDVRRGVVEALARIKRERAYELLKSALAGTDPSVSLAAATALGMRARPRREFRRSNGDDA